MQFDPKKHHRRSIRLPGYDYAEPGGYFVTIVVQHRRILLGEVNGGCVLLSPAGEMVKAVWEETPQRFPGVEVDTFVVMPNHFHGVVIIRPPNRVGAQFIAPNSQSFPVDAGGMNPARAKNPADTNPSLGEIVRAFKAVSTRRIRTRGMTSFAWQRNYYEHIIRDEDDLNRVRQYVIENPVYWEQDPEHPDVS